MENAAEALKMAAAVLIFVLALGISILSFSNARSTAQTILELKDREYDYTYVNTSSGTERIVGAETLIPTITRAYKENYKIMFYKKNGDKLIIYEKPQTANNTDTEINYIDLEKENLADDGQKDRFIEYILYGGGAGRVEFANKIKSLPNGPLCDTILAEGKRYREYLGEYYQEDLKESVDTDPNNPIIVDNVPEANKTKKRIVSYVAIE